MNKNRALEAAFVVAARDGQTEIMELLLEAGADIHAWKDVALRCASETGQVEAVRLLLRGGADAHAMDDDPLRIAEEHGHKEIVGLLQEWRGKSPSGPRPPSL